VVRGRYQVLLNDFGPTIATEQPTNRFDDLVFRGSPLVYQKAESPGLNVSTGSHSRIAVAVEGDPTTVEHLEALLRSPAGFTASSTNT